MRFWLRFRLLTGRVCTVCSGKGSVKIQDIIERIDRESCQACLGTGLRFVEIAERKRLRNV